MSQYGNVCFIDILESRQDGCTEARVVFQPPPRISDWFFDGIEIVDKKGGGTFNVHFKREVPRLNRCVSPLDPRMSFPAEIRLPVTQLTFGVMKTPTSMMKLHTTRAAAETALELTMNLQRKCLDIVFVIPFATAESGPHQRIYKMRINLAQMKQVYKMSRPTGQLALVIPTDSPPTMLRKSNDIASTHEEGSTTWMEWQTWFRQTEITSNPNAAKGAITQLQKEFSIIDIGRWTTYCLFFDPATASSRDFMQLCLALTHHHVTIAEDKTIDLLEGDSKFLWNWLDSPKSVLDQTTPSSELQQLAEEVTHLSFDVRYQLEVCISHGLIHESNITKDFLAQLARMDSTRALRLLEKVSDEKKRFWEPDQIFPKLLHQVSIMQLFGRPSSRPQRYTSLHQCWKRQTA
jgi:RNA-dependent RNA polymerase